MEDAPAIQEPAVPCPTVNVSPPPGLKDGGDLVEQWKMFKSMYDYYSVIAKLDKQPQEYQFAVFMHTIGPKGIQLYKVLSFEDGEDKKDVKLITTKLDEHIIGELNVIYERYQFNNRCQQNGESIDTFVAALIQLCKTCEFCDCLRDELVRDRIVVGIRKDATRKRLLAKKKLTLKAAIDICRSDESTESHLNAMGADAASSSVNKLNYRTYHKGNRSTKYYGNVSHDKKKVSNDHKECRYCGTEHLMRKDKCPAWGESCTRCGKLNHFSSKCHSKAIHAVHSDSASSDFFF